MKHGREIIEKKEGGGTYLYIDTKEEDVDNVYNITRRRARLVNWTNMAGGIGETCRSRCEVVTS